MKSISVQNTNLKLLYFGLSKNDKCMDLGALNGAHSFKI
jgi:hypothetical protein